MSNYKFDVDTTGLAAYVDKTSTEILLQLQMTSDLTENATVMAGIKGSKKIRFMDETVTLQSDSCAFNASGTTTFTEKTISVADIAVMEELCVQSLDRFWTEQVIRKGAGGYEVSPDEINKAYIDKRVNSLRKILNVADWTGDTSSATANINKYDGLIKYAFTTNVSDTVDGNTSNASSATSKSNILARMQEMYLAIPDDLFGDAPDGGDLVWFLPTDYYRFYIEALKDANLFHWKGGETDAANAGTYYGK